jgi:hypothetical protein
VKLAFLGLVLSAQAAAAQLPAGLEPKTRQVLEQLVDSAKATGLPTAPLTAKVAEGKLKQASDEQIVTAVRALVRRFGEIRASVGTSLDETSMTAAATAMSAGVSLSSIKGLLEAAGPSRVDFATALVTITDLVVQRVQPTIAVSAVQDLLARRAPADQYTRLRADVANDIGAGREPDQSIRSRTDAIIKSLPGRPPD